MDIRDPYQDQPAPRFGDSFTNGILRNARSPVAMGSGRIVAMAVWRKTGSVDALDANSHRFVALAKYPGTGTLQARSAEAAA